MRSFELRELKSTDLFLCLKILRKIGLAELKNRLNGTLVRQIVENIRNTNDEDSDNNTEVGMAVIMEVADLLLENVPTAEKEIMDFVSSVTGEDARDFSMAEFMSVLVQILKKEDFRDFFKAASELFK